MVDAGRQRRFEQHDGSLLHLREPSLRQGQAADVAAFVLHDEGAALMLQMLDGQSVFEGDGGWLPPLAPAEGGAAVVGEGFQVHCLGQGLDNRGFADAGASGQHQPTLGRARPRLVGQRGKGLEAGVAQLFVAARHPRHAPAGFCQPGLRDCGAQAAAPTIQPGVGMAAQKIRPSADAGAAHRSGDQLMAALDGGLPVAPLIECAHLMALIVGQEGQVHRGGEGALGELRRRAQVDQGNVVLEQVRRRHGRPPQRFIAVSAATCG